MVVLCCYCCMCLFITVPIVESFWLPVPSAISGAFVGRLSPNKIRDNEPQTDPLHRLSSSRYHHQSSSSLFLVPSFQNYPPGGRSSFSSPPTPLPLQQQQQKQSRRTRNKVRLFLRGTPTPTPEESQSAYLALLHLSKLLDAKNNNQQENNSSGGNNTRKKNDNTINSNQSCIFPPL